MHVVGGCPRSVAALAQHVVAPGGDDGDVSRFGSSCLLQLSDPNGCTHLRRWTDRSIE